MSRLSWILFLSSSLKIRSFVPLFLHTINYFSASLSMLNWTPMMCHTCQKWRILKHLRNVLSAKKFQSRRESKMLTATAAKSLQSCPTLCHPIDGSPPGSPVPGILQARTLEWVAISFSNAWRWKVKVKLLSRVRLFATPWTAAYQALPSMGFSRQEYWSGVPLPSPKC